VFYSSKDESFYPSSLKTSLLTGNNKLSRSNDLRKESSLGDSNSSSYHKSEKERSNVKKSEGMNIETSKINKIQRQELLFSLTRAYAIIVSRWGGYSRDIINTPAIAPSTRVIERPDSSITPLLNVLSFSTSYLKASWAFIQSNELLVNDLREMVDIQRR
jgi:hypothetical protein